MKKACLFVVILIAISSVCYSQIVTKPNVILLGDADEDGEITIVDALFIANHSVDKPVPSINLWAADVDGNSIVNIIDALLIAQFSVGKIPSFPPHEPAPLLGRWYDQNLLDSQGVEEGFIFYADNSAEMYIVVQGQEYVTISGTYTVSYNDETGRSHVVMDGEYMVENMEGTPAFIELDYSIVGDNLLLNQTSEEIPLGKTEPVHLALTKAVE